MRYPTRPYYPYYTGRKSVEVEEVEVRRSEVVVTDFVCYL